MNDTPIDEMSFEAALAELEQVVTRLERGDVPLEDSITLYERGAKLKAHCEARLQAAQMRVEAIRLAEDGTPKGHRAVHRMTSFPAALSAAADRVEARLQAEIANASAQRGARCDGLCRAGRQEAARLSGAGKRAVAWYRARAGRGGCRRDRSDPCLFAGA